MTSPLREMVSAARAMAAGDYSLRVRATSADEVGELARAFNAMAAELAEVDRGRRDLVANASHELRTPIAALQATLENLVDGVVQPTPELLTTMLHQAERLATLVTQLLDLSRLESGAIPLQVRRFEVAELLDAAVDEARLQATDATVVVDVAPPGLEAEGDVERLHQVVANLLANALRHSPPGGTVTVRGRANGTGLELEIRDEGSGIPPGEAQRVFERFYRADKARSDGGAGLGLAIARWIVELHGGSVRPETGEPSGCRMVVELPGRRR